MDRKKKRRMQNPFFENHKYIFDINYLQASTFNSSGVRKK